MKSGSRWLLVVAALGACMAAVLLRPPSSPELPPPGAKTPEPAPDTADSGQRPAERTLRLAPDRVDFGEIRVGERKTLSIEVLNSGKRPVTVLRTLFNCTCMNGNVEPSRIEPGETGKLLVTFTGTPGRRAYSTVASFITDESGACRYDVGLEGKVQQEFILEPETLSFGTLELGATKKLDSIVRRRDGAAFEIQDIKASRPEFSFISTPVEGGAGSAYRITATAQALRPALLSESAQVLTNRDVELSPQLILSMEVQGEVSCAPGVAIARLAPDGKLPPFETVLTHKKGSAIKVESLRESRELLLEHETETLPNGSVRLRIVLKDGFPRGAPFGEFLITLGEDPEPVRLPYRIERAPGTP